MNAPALYFLNQLCMNSLIFYFGLIQKFCIETLLKKTKKDKCFHLHYLDWDQACLDIKFTIWLTLVCKYKKTEVRLREKYEYIFVCFYSRVALTGPRSVAINSLHPCSHWPLFAIAPPHCYKVIQRLRVICFIAG